MMIAVIASADPDDDDGDRADPHYLVAGTWAAIELALPAWYYWHTQRAQSVDWTLHWDWASWRAKLVTFSAVRFDTNPFGVNAFRHPLIGIGDYQIGRTNGFGVLGSTLLAYGTGFIWEYFIEYRENPAINDLILNGAGGLALGEPLYQIGQLWRGDDPSVLDRLRTAAFSPFDAVQDLWRPHRRVRHRPWARFWLAAGALERWFDGAPSRTELAVSGDIDLIRSPGMATGEAPSADVSAGGWNAVSGEARFGTGGDLVGIRVRSDTLLTGRYLHEGDGSGTLYGVATGFLYRRDLLPEEWDRLAVAHLIGATVHYVYNEPGFALRWDTALYADFALIQAHEFGPVSPLPAPPPLFSTVQADGYYDAAGLSGVIKVRAEKPPWELGLDVSSHLFWQFDGADRPTSMVPPATSSLTGAAVPPSPAGTTPVNPFPVRPRGMNDSRIYVRGLIEYRITDELGIAATFESAIRHGVWDDVDRQTADMVFGLRVMATR